MTKLHLIASSRGSGKVDVVTKGDHHDFLGVLIDGMGRKEGATIAPRTLP